MSQERQEEFSYSKTDTLARRTQHTTYGPSRATQHRRQLSGSKGCHRGPHHSCSMHTEHACCRSEPRQMKGATVTSISDTRSAVVGASRTHLTVFGVVLEEPLPLSVLVLERVTALTTQGTDVQAGAGMTRMESPLRVYKGVLETSR